jgi:glucokinase
MILQAPNLAGMINFPMKEKLEKEFRVPVVVGNDANLAALGEHRLGAGRGVAHMIYLTISTGIGGGIIADHQLFLGARGFAGEVGHQTLDAYGPRCNCGNVGCLEVLAAGPAIVRMTREAMRGVRDSKLREQVGIHLDQLTGEMITQAARAGDFLAREVYQRAGFFIGLGMVNLLHNFDTQMFVLGGGVAINAWDLIYPAMTDVFNKYAMPSMRRDVQIVQAQLGDEAGLIGAAMLAIEQTQ